MRPKYENDEVALLWHHFRVESHLTTNKSNISVQTRQKAIKLPYEVNLTPSPLDHNPMLKSPLGIKGETYIDTCD